MSRITAVLAVLGALVFSSPALGAMAGYHPKLPRTLHYQTYPFRSGHPSLALGAWS